MSLFRHCLLLLLILLAAPAFAAGDSGWFYRGSDIQPDPAWVFGTLPNGLRYAVRRNAMPAGQVSIRLRMDVGSLMETDQERGWAHFVEHMVFRGTAISGDREARETWQRLGAGFGSDTNAFTQETQTFFQLDLPHADRAALDTSLDLLDGMVDTATFDPAKVELERGVVLSEYGRRTQLNVELGDLTRSLFYAGLAFADRDAIGTEATIRAATPAGLKAFYERWYRPERATLVMVGDADPAMMEQLIADHFGGWRGTGPAPAEPDYGHIAPVRDSTALLAYPGAPHVATLAWVRPYKAMPHTQATAEIDFARAIAARILNRRLEARARAGADFLSAVAHAGRSNHVADYTELQVTARDGRWQQALADAFAIVADARRTPPSVAELARELRSIRANALANLSADPTIRSQQRAAQFVEAVDDDSIVTGARQALSLFDGLAPRMTPDAVEAAMRAMFDGIGPRMVLLAPQPVTGLHEALAAAERAPPSERPADRVVSMADLPPLGDPGHPGHEASRRHIDDLDVTIVRFDNGSTLVFKQTDFDKSSVSVELRFGTGLSGLPANRRSLSWMAPVLAEMGVGPLDLDGLERLRTGRRLSVGFGADEEAWVMTGSTDGPQLGDELRLLATEIVAPHWDPSVIERVKASALDYYALGFASATARAGREFPLFAHDGDLRWSPQDRDEIARITPADFRKFFEPLLADGPIEAVIVGDTSLDNAVAAMLKTVAALPRRAPVAMPPGSLAVSPPKPNPNPETFTHQGDPGQAFAMLGWSTFGGTQGFRDQRGLIVAADILQERLIEQLRDADGATYTPEAGATSSQDFPAWGVFYAGAEVRPERTDLFFRTARAIVADMARRPAGADEFARALNPVLSGLERAQHTNAYWLGALQEWSRRPERIEQTRTRFSDYRSLTPEEVRRDVAAYVADAPDWSMLVLPARTAAVAPAAAAPAAGAH
ncbi:MAG TPA: insulinase family protein [Allosphingosinicella sp.]|nr:insulinase family protein [Allosphingosinicella sp.]